MLTLPFELERDRAPQIGLIALQSDESIERDMWRLLPSDVELLVSRVPSGTHVTQETLAEMEGALGTAAGLFPVSAEFSAIGYGCTSGTAQIGADKVKAAVRSTLDVKSVTEPVSALIGACRHLNVSRLGLLTPYVAEVSDRLRDVLAESGITITGFGSFNESEEGKVARIASTSIVAAAIEVVEMDELDALFISCTNLRTLDVIEEIEQKTGMPVLSSNLVLAWHLLDLVGLKPSADAPGRIWTAS